MALRTAVSIEAAAIAYVSSAEYHGAYPCESTTPFFESKSGCKTPASAFTLPLPCSGFVTEPPCTSWSYCCDTNDIEPTLVRERIASIVLPASDPSRPGLDVKAGPS